MNSKQTEAALQKAQKEYYGAEQERAQFLEDKMAPVHAEFHRQKQNVLTEVSNKFEAKMRDLNVALNRAKKLHEETLVAERNADTGWLPVGTKVVLWEKRRWGESWHKTDTKGVVDVWTSDSERPGNVGHYSVPHVGRVYVRHLKADGSLSKKFSTVHINHPRWFADGVEPPKEEK